MAQLVAKAGQSEMHIGLNTSAFGSVDVHTVVHANEVGVSIGSEKGDLRSLLANELPGIVNTLQQHNLRLDHVNFQQGYTPSNHPGRDAQQRSFTRPGALQANSRNEIDRGERREASTSVTEGLGTGLSVLA
jgi:flagellar hook-length control protein FliK